MPVVDHQSPPRLLAGGGPSAPDARVRRAMALPVIGQFDPAFTALMDDVMALGRQTFVTSNARCFAVSGLASAGLEAVLAALLVPGGAVSAPARLHGLVQRLGGTLGAAEGAPIVVADAQSADVPALARAVHARGAVLIVDATAVLGGREVRVDGWGIDACVAGVDYCLGAPSGMALVTYSDAVEARMRARTSLLGTSYLDLLELQAYWSPERLNHHTAPTSLVYGLREALRLVHVEGLEARWARHARIAEALAAGLRTLEVHYVGTALTFEVELPAGVDEAQARRGLREHFGIHVLALGVRTWRLGLLGADAQVANVARLLTGLAHVLDRPSQTAVEHALARAGVT